MMPPSAEVTGQTGCAVAESPLVADVEVAVTFQRWAARYEEEGEAGCEKYSGARDDR